MLGLLQCWHTNSQAHDNIALPLSRCSCCCICHHVCAEQVCNAHAEPLPHKGSARADYTWTAHSSRRDATHDTVFLAHGEDGSQLQVGYSHEVAKPQAPARQLSARAGQQERALEQEIKRRLASAAEPAGNPATQQDALHNLGLM